MLLFSQEKYYCACVVDEKQFRALLPIGSDMKSSRAVVFQLNVI